MAQSLLWRDLEYDTEFLALVRKDMLLCGDKVLVDNVGAFLGGIISPSHVAREVVRLLLLRVLVGGRRDG